MSWRYSVLEHDEVWVDEHDTNRWCDECDKEFDLEDEGGTDDDTVFCGDCYDEIFGG